MSTAEHNLSLYNKNGLPDASEMRVAIVVSEWNREITERLEKGAYDTLVKNGVKPDNITIAYVPGSFELVYGSKRISDCIHPDAVIGLGCVIKGETPHFNYICSGVSYGFAKLNAKGTIPFIFGLLTDNNIQQSKDRAGGRLGNKGIEAAVTALKMFGFSCKFK